MGLDLNSLAGQSANITSEFMGHSIDVSYNPMVLTQARVAEARKTDEGFMSYFCELVTAWDVKAGTKKVPLTVAGLNKVPFPLVRRIFSDIYSGTGKATEEEGNDSSGG